MDIHLTADRATAGSPEDVVLGDRTLQALALCLAVLFAVGVYSAKRLRRRSKMELISMMKFDICVPRFPPPLAN